VINPTTATIHPALSSMLGECIDHQLPAHYRGDLSIDIATLLNLPTDKPFIWMLRECGTHIFSDRPHSLHTLFQYETRRFYVWDGNHLKDGLQSHSALALFDKLTLAKKAARRSA